MNNTAIEIMNLSFSYGKNKVLEDISVNIKKNDYISVLGPNGSGKTTLLKCLIGIYRDWIGNISIAGKPAKNYSQKQLTQQISYIPQAVESIIPFSVNDFLLMGCYPYSDLFSRSDKEDKDAVENALKLTKTTGIKNRIISTLSGGERQKVLIAAALAQRTSIILLDEPTTYLDPKHEEEVHNLLAYINQNHGVTIISVTHNINYAVLSSRKVLAFKGGSIAYFGDSKKFLNNNNLYKIYGKKFHFMIHPETGEKIITPGVTKWDSK